MRVAAARERGRGVAWQHGIARRLRHCGWGDVMTENAGKDARGPDLVWRVPSLGAPAPSPAWDCGGWDDVVTENAGKGARGPDLVRRVPSLGAPPPSPAWDCGGVMWGDP